MVKNRKEYQKQYRNTKKYKDYNKKYMLAYRKRKAVPKPLVFGVDSLPVVEHVAEPVADPVAIAEPVAVPEPVAIAEPVAIVKLEPVDYGSVVVAEPVATPVFTLAEVLAFDVANGYITRAMSLVAGVFDGDRVFCISG